MSDTTVNLGLPLIQAAQAQKHVTHNEALRLIDSLMQLAILDRDLAAPPGTPDEGQRWIVAASPTGAWAGHGGQVAAWQDGGWDFSAPQVGWVAFVVDEGTLIVWNGTAWGDFFSTVTAIQNLARLGIGTTADTTNPLSAKLNNVLWIAKTVAEGGDGNLRYKLSKESATKSLSFLLQDNFSGRAEIGLTGDDDFHIKVSNDGSSWIDALTIQRNTGNVSTGVIAAKSLQAGATPDQSVSIDVSGKPVTIANGGNQAISIGNGLLVVCDKGSGAVAIWNVQGSNITALDLGVGSIWITSTTSPASGKASVAYASGAVRIYNNIGTARNFTACQLGL